MSSEEFDELAGPAGLNDEDTDAIVTVDDDELIPEVEVDDALPLADDDGSLAEKGEEDEEAELFNEYLLGDDANAM
jgi:hypothetical protein